MISYQAILVELEKHLQAAKSASNEQQFREALVATKALCDVVLQLPMTEQQKTAIYKEFTQAKDTTGIETTSIHSVASQQFTSLQRLEEEDGANGASIFDF